MIMWVATACSNSLSCREASMPAGNAFVDTRCPSFRCADFEVTVFSYIANIRGWKANSCDIRMVVDASGIQNVPCFGALNVDCFVGVTTHMDVFGSILVLLTPENAVRVSECVAGLVDCRDVFPGALCVGQEDLAGFASELAASSASKVAISRSCSLNAGVTQ